MKSRSNTAELAKPFTAPMEVTSPNIDGLYNLTDIFLDGRSELERPFIDYYSLAHGSLGETSGSPPPRTQPQISLDKDTATANAPKSRRHGWGLSSNGIVHVAIYTEGQLERLRPRLATSGSGDENRRAECFFIRQRNTNSRLSTSRSLFVAVAALWGVFSHIQDHLMSFGFKVNDDDFGPPRCRMRTYTTPSNDLDSVRKGSSPGSRGSHTQLTTECVYGLRYAEKSNGKSPLDTWRIRQSAIYQKYDPSTQRETWLVISASNAMEAHLQDHLGTSSQVGSQSTDSVHAALITAAVHNWRWYIKTLTSIVTDQTKRVIAADIGEAAETDLVDFGISFEDRQILKTVEDKILDLFVIFDSTTDTLRELYFHWTGINPDSCTSFTENPAVAILRDSIAEMGLYRKKAKNLLEKLRGTIALLSDLLDTQINRALQTLAQESRHENKIMRQLTEKGTNDAAAVKGITVITILYLPTSVVASFFSTQFVSRENDSNGNPRLNFTDNWWLYVAISVPLTIFTIAIWYAWISWPWRSLNEFLMFRLRGRRAQRLPDDAETNTYERAANLVRQRRRDSSLLPSLQAQRAQTQVSVQEKARYVV